MEQDRSDRLVAKGRVWYCRPGSNGAEFCQTGQKDSEPYDVTIIGAGVVGCAVAYRLSQYQVRVLLIDRNFDVGEGTSKANSAIIHTGFDATPDSLESRLVTAASRLWPQLAEKLKIPFDPISALLLALDQKQADQLGPLHQKALANGVDDVEVVDAAKARQLEPGANKNVRGGLLVHRESIIDPFTVSIAFAEVAVANGVDILFGSSVIAVEDANQTIKTIVDDNGHRIKARIIVNVAGLGSRAITQSHGGKLFDINPRRGQFLIFDKSHRGLVNRILLPVPTATTKGKLVTPTIFGNVLAGPTAEDLPPGDDTATFTTIEGLQEVHAAAARMCPTLDVLRPIATYAGLRCNCSQGSYIIRANDGHHGIVTASGIRSTGLTSSPALADYLIEQIVEHCGLSLRRDADARDSRPQSSWPGWCRRPFEDPEKIAANQDYGRMVCFCEQISQGEIIDALDSPLSPCTLDSIKRRTRVLTGRCQGFNCGVRIAEIISQHLGVPLDKITKRGPGTQWISSRLPDGVQPNGARAGGQP